MAHALFCAVRAAACYGRFHGVFSPAESVMSEPQATGPVKAEPPTAGEGGPCTREEISSAGITSERQQVRSGREAGLRALTGSAVAVGATLAAFLLRRAVQKYLGHELPTFFTFYPAVMLVGTCLGVWAGALTTVTSALLVAYWIIPAENIGIATGAEAVVLGIFVLVGTMMSVVAELYRRNRRKAAEYEKREALRASEELNQRMVRQAEERRKVAEAVQCEQLRLNDVLRQQQFYARSLLEASLDPLVTISREGKITDVNRATEAVTGGSREELIGSDFCDYFTEPEKARTGYRQVFADGFVQDYPLAIRHSSGRLTNVLYNATVFRNQKGEVEGVFAAARDITKRKLAERGLQEQQFYTRSLIEASLDPLVTISRGGKITDVNRATEAATGVEREQLIGSDFCDYFTEPEKARAGYQQVFADGFVQDYPLAIRHRTGRLTEVLYNATVFRNQTGEIGGVFAAARDVTKQKQAESEAQRYMQELERSNAELQDFASIASHDLQEPLRKVLSFGEHLKEHSGDKLDELGLDFLARMQNAARRMSVLIEALLQYSRVATKAQPPQPVDMLTVIFGVVADLEERIAKSHARIKFALLPKVMADPMQVRQLMQNLVANGLKFQRPGSQPHLEIEGRVTDGGRCEIIVRDNGIGFEEKYLDRIFRPFQRLHGRSEYEGSGMGLAICRKVAARHGGTLTAHSRPGEGSTFVVTLPAVAEVQVELQERKEPWLAEKVANKSESCSPKTMTTITS
jgi:PAS domain S-box-containing protein